MVGDGITLGWSKRSALLSMPHDPQVRHGAAPVENGRVRTRQPKSNQRCAIGRKSTRERLSQLLNSSGECAIPAGPPIRIFDLLGALEQEGQFGHSLAKYLQRQFGFGDSRLEVMGDKEIMPMLSTAAVVLLKLVSTPSPVVAYLKPHCFGAVEAALQLGPDRLSRDQRTVLARHCPDILRMLSSTEDSDLLNPLRYTLSFSLAEIFVCSLHLTFL